MIIEFDKSFERSLDKIRNKLVFQRINDLIIELEKADSLKNARSVKKLVGFKNYYRIRIGEYRLGFEKINDKIIRFIIIAHRKDIYNLFP
jgi:mRNA interferase RelE/StbE